MSEANKIQLIDHYLTKLQVKKNALKKLEKDYKLRKKPLILSPLEPHPLELIKQLKKDIKAIELEIKAVQQLSFSFGG